MKIYKPVQGVIGFDNVKPAFVVDDLSSLHGPTEGIVSLPPHLDWTPNPQYDLSRSNRVRTLYATVLREAHSEEDLTSFLANDLLVTVWRSLRIPGSLRDAWEARHPELHKC